MQQSKNSESAITAEVFQIPSLKVFKDSWGVLLIGSIFGLVSAIGYLMVAHPVYRAVAQIRMAQISQVNPANPFGTTVEEPSPLIARMRFPTNYSKDVVVACGYENSQEPYLEISKDLKFSMPKGVANTVELVVHSQSPQIALTCAQAVYMQIVDLQGQFSKPFVEEAKIKLASDNERILMAKALIEKADRSGSAMSAAYLAARDELTYFLADRERMMDLINSVKNRGTSLASPIYVSEKPVSPKKSISLALGLLLGFIFGLLVVIGKNVLSKPDSR